MTVAIVHYHLGPGGVGQVIAAASRVLTAAGVRNVILVDSEPACCLAGLPVRLVSGLGYRSTAGDFRVDDLAKRLRLEARDALGRDPDVWHFHNHALGKNPLMPEIVARLAEEGERIVLQIHDLAEDGRPGNYQLIEDPSKLYPVSSRIYYAFLNSRDFHIFKQAGLTDERAGVIVNPIRPAEARPRKSGETGDPLVFAPVRCIRRKNIGEVLFLAALAPAGARFALSRAPLNPEALEIHDTWRKFAERQQLPVGFDVVDRFTPAAGAGAGYESWLDHATHLITSSVAEGFGLPFLESIALGKPLIGRNLSHITAEHARHGIRAGDLYDALLVPVEWVDGNILRVHLTATLERNYRAYRLPLTRKCVDATFDSLLQDGWLDFGNLPESLQQGAIERVGDPGCRRTPLVRQSGQTRPAADWLAAALSNRQPGASPDQLAHYADDAYLRSLKAIHTTLTRQPPSAVRYLNPAPILDAHLSPDSFHFLLSAIPKPSAPAVRYRAVVFDIYGTLLIAPPGGVKPDPEADPILREIIEEFGHTPPASPSSDLHAAVLRHHAAAALPFPEIDLRILWREVLSLESDVDVRPLVVAIESAWHPSRPMPGAVEFIQRLSRAGISLGLLSNAQCNTMESLGPVRDLFAPELTILSYQHGMAKPSPALFETLLGRLAGRGIKACETLFIGNDPLHDIAPAAAAGFATALFTGHPDSLRPGDCLPDFEIADFSIARMPDSADLRIE